MPRYWGSWTDVGGYEQRFRLGMDWSRSGTRVTVDQYLFESAFSIHKDITLTRTGRLSGTYSVGVSTSGGVVSLGRGGSVTGSRGGSVTIGGRATNVLHGLVPSFSTSISIPAVAPSAPGRPSVSNLTASSVRNAWSAPSSNGGASITQYQVQYSTSSNFSGTTWTYNNGTSRNRTQSLANANTTHWVRVRARNSAGWGPWSSSRSFTSLPLRPNTPTNVRAEYHSDAAFTVRWDHSSPSDRPADRYRVQRRVYNLGWGNWVTRATVSGSTSSYRDTTQPNRAYQWRVVAVNDAGSATSDSSAVRYTTPWHATHVEAVTTANGIRVSWENRVRFGNYEHQIQHQSGGPDGGWFDVGTHPGGASLHGTRSSWTLRDPDLSVIHRFAVRSRTTEGPLRTSEWQYTDWVRLAAPPSAPTNLGPSGVWDASEDRTLTWRHVPTDDSDQERFQVRHRLQGGSWTTVSAVASESEQWTLPGGTYSPGDTIEWQVRTMGVHPDWGPWSASNFQQPTSRPTVAINAPEDGEEIETNSVLVTWGYSGPDQDDGDEGEISGQAAWRLTVLRGSNVVTEESGSDDRDSFLVRGLSDDATYTIRVQVRSGEGLWSAEADAVTFPVSYLPPAPPQIGVAFDRDLGAAVVDVQTAPPHEPYEYVNVVTNPRGRPADTGVDDDPLAARQALLDALAAYTDAPVTWSATEPGDTSVVWVDPGTGVAQEWTGPEWVPITDPDVVAAGQEYQDAAAGFWPVGWSGAGIWWSAEHDAVYVPQGTEATVPTAALPDTVTLVLLDAETGESAQYWDHTDATIPADTAPRYLRAAIVEGEFVGPYFDGDYPRGPGQDGSLATYAWDGQPHDSPTTATITSLETESVQLWRAIDDGPWLLIADEVPPDTAISDPIPAIGDRRVNHYRATSVSGIGSAMHSDEHQLTVPTHGPGGNHGWVYLNGGQDFSDVVKVRANATRSGSQGLAKTVRRYAGNPRPQQVSGTAVSRTWSIGVSARETLYEEGMSRPEEIEALQVNGGVVCYRDPLGARWFASMGMMDDSYRAITGEVSWSMEEVDQPEGLARESRDQSGDDDADGEPV